MLKIKTIQCNALAENCYIVSDDSRECIIIDCGAHNPFEQSAIKEYIAAEQLTPVIHLLTHGHFDHAMGSKFVHDTWGLLPTLCERDAEQYKGAKQMAAAMGLIIDDLPVIGKCLNDGDTVTFGNGKSFRVIETPGHTKGSAVYYSEAEHVAFTGDTLFHLGIGRTDFPGGSTFMIIQSLRQLTQLPDETQVFPGHGDATTIGYELAHNPYLDR